MSQQLEPVRSTTFTTITTLEFPDRLREKMINGGKPRVCVSLVEPPVPGKYLKEVCEKPGSGGVTVRRYGWGDDANFQALGHLQSPEHDGTKEACLLVLGLDHGELNARQCEMVVEEIRLQPGAAVFILVCSHMASWVFEFLRIRCPPTPKGVFIVETQACRSSKALARVETRLTALPRARS